MEANQDMVDGYLDGFEDHRKEFPESLSNRGRSYRHGWLNGLADRLHRPRWRNLAEAELAADLAMKEDQLP